MIYKCNELSFKLRYEDLVQSILSSIPNVCLVIQSILPVNNKLFINCKNSKIGAFNCLIKGIADYYNFFYIDLSPFYVTSGGELDKYIPMNGIHLHQYACFLWKVQLIHLFGK